MKIHENASDRPAIILGSPGGAWKRPRVLGPILSARFKHLTQPAQGDPKMENTHRTGELGTKRMCETTPHPNKKPRGASIIPQKFCRRGVATSLNHDGTSKPSQQLGEIVEGGSCDNEPALTKKPKLDGEFHPTASGENQADACSSLR